MIDFHKAMIEIKFFVSKHNMTSSGNYTKLGEFENIYNEKDFTSNCCSF